MIRVFAMKVSDQDFSGDRWNDYLSGSRRREGEKKKQKKERQLFLGAEVLLNTALRRIFPDMGIPAAYGRNAHGKPYLLPPHENIYINWSHSGEYVLCAVADREVGVDLQENTKKPAERMIRRALQPKERAYYECQAEEERKIIFYEYWALKESFLKALGTGFQTSLEMFHIQMKENDPQIIQQVNEKSYQCRLLQFQDPAYTAAVCWEGEKEQQETVIEYL